LENWGLVRVSQLESFHGLIFANWDPEAPDLHEYLGAETRWGIDTLLDQREGGTEVVGGVIRWMLDCNWKFAADNFIGDNYHGAVTHASAMMVGHATMQRNAEARRNGAPSVGSVPGMSFTGRFGHGFNAGILPPGTGPSRRPEPLGSYYESTSAETRERLGAVRADQIARINCSVFPNLSLSSSSGMLHVWHPRGPFNTEVWLYILVDKVAPEEVKSAFRLMAQHHFGPSGMFEQDDGENWNLSTMACASAVARRYPLNYSMGQGHEHWVEASSAVPRHRDQMVNEYNQRGFYQHWGRMMEAKDWGEVLAASE